MHYGLNNGWPLEEASAAWQIREGNNPAQVATLLLFRRTALFWRNDEPMGYNLSCTAERLSPTLR